MNHKQMQKPRILIVEDESIIAMVLKIQLQKFGYEICAHASDGNTAIELFKQEKPDAILMDIGLPRGMDGIETCKIIKSENPDIPVIFVTGYDNLEIRSEALLLNPLGYIVKPAKIEKINELLESYFKMQNQEKK